MRFLSVVCSLLPLATPPVAAAAASGQSGARSGWSVQRSGASETLTAVSFPDRLHGHVVGAGGTILATNDGGRSWTQQYACTSSAPCTSRSSDRVTNALDGVSFPDQTHGWAVGVGGTILATADGGQTWSQQLACAQTAAAVVQQYCQPQSADRVTQALRSVSFVDSAHGWAVGSGETMLATADGGRTWVQQIACLWQTPAYNPNLFQAVGPNGVPAAQRAAQAPCPPRPQTIPARDLWSVSFIDQLHGVAVGAGSWAVFTEDGGQNWYGGQVPKTMLQLRGVTMTVANIDDLNQDAMHAVGVAGQVLVSGLKGAHWWYGTGGNDELTGQPSVTTNTLNAVDFTDHMNGHAVGEGGTIVVTSDEGQHWSLEPSGTTNALNGVSFADAHHGFAVGDGGTILAYTAAAPGLSVTAVAPPEVPEQGAIPVSITGHGFTGATEVNFGKAYAAGFTVDSDTHITAMAPRELAGTHDVTVVEGEVTSGISGADPVTVLPPGGGDWNATAHCPGRCDGPAVRLHDGRVLVSGSGTGDETSSTDAELYDPASSRWRAVGPMNVPRRDAVSVVLPDGRVIVAGGEVQPSEATASAEIYDPRTGRWSMAPRMGHARESFSGVLLADGEVLVAGGYETLGVTNPAFVDRRFGDTQLGSPYSTATAELFNPKTATWRTTGSMRRTRAFDTLLVLHNGSVLAVGDDARQDSHLDSDATAELYDPRTGLWAPTGPLNIARSYVRAIQLGDGRVLAAGGVVFPFDRPAYGLPFAEVYDPATGSWTPTGPMVYARVFQSMTLLADGRVLVTGGRIGSDTYCPPCTALSQAEIFDPAINAWQLVASASEARVEPVSVLLNNGSVLETGVDGVSELFTPAEPGAPNATGVPWFVWFAVSFALLSGCAAALALRLPRRRGPPPPPSPVSSAQRVQTRSQSDEAVPVGEPS